MAGLSGLGQDKRIVLILFSPLLLDLAGLKLKKTKEPVQKSDTLSTKLKTVFFLLNRLFRLFI